MGNSKSKKEWDNGFNAGYDMATSLNRAVMTEDFPKSFSSRSSYFNMGYAEGVMSGERKKNQPNKQ
jgi:hypothetical protein